MVENKTINTIIFLHCYSYIQDHYDFRDAKDESNRLVIIEMKNLLKEQKAIIEKQQPKIGMQEFKIKRQESTIKRQQEENFILAVAVVALVVYSIGVHFMPNFKPDSQKNQEKDNGSQPNTTIINAQTATTINSVRST